MTTASRRIFFYWLLLIIPTLAVGAAAFWLLHREQVHIREQASAAAATRQAAILERTRLIAENIEIIMADVQSGLMGTLLDAPAENAGEYLANWQRTNPLVHDVFVAAPTGALRWGTPSTPVTAWLATTPWRVSVTQPSPVSPPVRQQISTTGDSKIVAEESLETSVFRAAQSDKQSETLAPPESFTFTGNTAQYQSARAGLNIIATYNSNVGAIAPIQQNQPLIQADTKIAKSTVKDEGAAFSRATTSVITSEIIPASVIVPDITGWTPWTDASGALRLFGWRMTSRGTVLVVEANLAAIASRLSEVLPQEIAPDEAYALFGNANGQIARVGSVSGDNRKLDISQKTTPPPRQIHEQPLGLPGWRVTGYILADTTSSAEASRAFFLLSALLVGLFVIAIIGGGSLLLRQARLSAAESAQKTSFVANVSHEFKTPLTTIRLYSELLEHGRIPDNAKRAESLQTISRETQRLARLVNNVLDFSRLEQGRKKFDLTRHDLREQIARILDHHAPRLTEAGLRLDYTQPDTPCVIQTDIDALEQIVLNLLDNASKYASTGGEVSVLLSGTRIESSTGFQPVGLDVARASSPCKKHGQDAHATLSITISDRGPGIPAAHREKIFEKFHRVDDTLTAAQGGAGLGLSIARQLARGLGGDLAYSPREGGGSNFTLTLPL
jgi:signal transduction histidine kinase